MMQRQLDIEYLQNTANNADAAQAANAAGILGDTYFLDDQTEVSALSNQYNLLAGKKYQQCEKIDLACHYYNQYLTRARNFSDYQADEVIHALSYLLENNLLVCTDKLLVLLQKMADNTNDDMLKNKFTRLISRAENRTIYMEVDKQETKKTLQAALLELEALRIEPTRPAMR